MSQFAKKIVAVATLAAVSGAYAIEPGHPSIYPVGVENFTCCALPPPGVYGMVWGGHLEMDKVRDNNGNNLVGTAAVPADFNIKVTAVVPRLIWVTPIKVGDASLALHGIFRSEERRVGKECRRLCRSRWSPYH
jgi:hypothetical protein